MTAAFIVMSEGEGESGLGVFESVDSDYDDDSDYD